MSGTSLSPVLLSTWWNSNFNRDFESTDSWVELSNSGNSSIWVGPQPSCSGNLEKLLIEAQKESRNASISNSKESSARGSPKSPHSPNNEPAAFEENRDPGTDWIWDWSSRPEALPPSDLASKFKHRSAKHKFSVRNRSVMKKDLFSMENLPTLLLTHACTFFLGAAVMMVCLKKCCAWGLISLPSGN